ncbi:hypothetical protein B0J13DRAFT_584352 [Dactylonectria estremocensis]|uniref:Homeobox domain-containing protein n=1 Tax=Dactylonectria estremocensis TaxID=1079267 RepID=A0A9P9EXG1_9HYPO|nr:hypothetical protein B0J13DRAFT_584352 [Dactylonectria estremocensis]
MHSHHPFASEEDKEMLQRQTGLSKTQIANWLSNSRRRGKIQGPNLALLQPQTNSTGSIEIQRRPGTPAPKSRMGLMNPLERWVDSPPENEPAIATAIARAMASSSRASSGNVVTLRSSGGSAHSYDSPDLNGPLKLFSRSHARRKKRIAFERWVCASNGLIELDSEQKPVCVFCGMAAPDEAHIKSHNYADYHLGQYLRLVHNVKAADLRGPLSRWKVAGSEIRLRCGFCGVSMETWGFRADHLADHFKSGNTMADWKGDWGFETDVLASKQCTFGTASKCNKLIELELMHFMQGCYDSPMRSSTECRLPVLTILGQVGFFESCPLEQQLHEFSTSPAEFVANWLIELVASSTSWLSSFRRRANISEPESGAEIGSIMKNYAELERRLSEYVDLLRAHGIEADDATLQHQARDLIAEFNDEECKKVALSNNTWLMAFKRRYISGPSGQVALELARWVVATMSPNNPNQHVLTDEELQHQARWIYYDDDDPWNQMPADNPEWLRRFKIEIGILKEPNLDNL